MKPIPECVPDALEMVLQAARLVSEESFIHRKVLAMAMARLLESGNFGDNPAELVHDCLMAAHKALGVRDPYEKEKARSVKAFLGLEKQCREWMDSQPDRLRAAVDLSFAGALIDSDVLGRGEAESRLPEQLKAAPVRDGRAELVLALEKAARVLMVLDRAAETVLDVPLAAELSRRGKKVLAAAVTRPVLDMATLDDAKAAGIAEWAEIIEPGGSMLGLSIAKASVPFRERFAEADVVLSKGQTHFATLSAGAERPVWFLLRASCPYVARAWDVPARTGVAELWGVMEAQARNRHKTELITRRETSFLRQRRATED